MKNSFIVTFSLGFVIQVFLFSLQKVNALLMNFIAVMDYESNQHNDQLNHGMERP